MLRLLKHGAFKWSILTSIVLLYACQKKIDVVQITGSTMGTTYSVKYLPLSKSKNPKEISKSIEKILISFNQVASTYISNSEISKINKLEPGEIVQLSDEFVNLFIVGKEISMKSQGYFDPSLGPLINLWGFGPSGKKSRVPTEAEIMSAKNITGMNKFKFYKDKKTLVKKKNAQYLDFSAFAKGRGVELISSFLTDESILDFMVEIGGEIQAASKTKKWNIGIELPGGSRSSFQTISLSSGAIATSGDYRNIRNYSNTSFSHGINFRSGRPKENSVASVSVYDPESCMKADAWATALMVAGEVEGPQLAEKNGIAAYFIYKESDKSSRYVIHRTSHWIKFVKEN